MVPDGRWWFKLHLSGKETNCGQYIFLVFLPSLSSLSVRTLSPSVLLPCTSIYLLASSWIAWQTILLRVN